VHESACGTKRTHALQQFCRYSIRNAARRSNSSNDNIRCGLIKSAKA
jgi:hypothetical protein